MRAFVIAGARQAGVEEVEPPVAGAGQVVVDVERVGICGTDLEFFSGAMSYLHTGQARYPMRIGHEWVGTVAAIGAGVDAGWIGRRVVADTMLGCGRCERCANGRQHLCADRYEIGVRGGWPGALADQLLVPASALVTVPDSLDLTAGALIEPGANSLRAVQAAALSPGQRLLVIGTGAIGLLAAMIARAGGAEVHLVARRGEAVAFAHSVGFDDVWLPDRLPDLAWDAVMDASNDRAVPAQAIELVEPGGRVVFIGLSGEPSLVDSRILAFKDATAVGVLSGSGGQAGTIDRYVSGAVEPRPLVAATVSLEELANVLGGTRRPEWGAAPKIHVDPRR
jgi:2-desacetyl-2-hydroxyethyl bacteriochlorophyllide A dehydrogenase